MPINFISSDAEFCGFCGAILQTPQYAPSIVACMVCGNEWHVEERNNQLVCRVEKIYKRTIVDVEMMDDKHAGDSYVEHICSNCLSQWELRARGNPQKCGHNKSSYTTMQTRSADEGQTVFYTCLKCRKKDIEYS